MHPEVPLLPVYVRSAVDCCAINERVDDIPDNPIRCLKPATIEKHLLAVGLKTRSKVHLLQVIEISDQLIRERVDDAYLATASQFVKYLHASIQQHFGKGSAKDFSDRWIVPEHILCDHKLYGERRFKETPEGRIFLGIVFNLQEIRIWAEEHLRALESRE
jgi:hypothetical protein